MADAAVGTHRGRAALRQARGQPPAGAADVAALIAGAAAAYGVVAQRRDADGPMVDRALEIVRKFIVERDLILFGGLAIDYALRLRGDRIYPDEQRPDFDFLSPRSVDDAYDLADILQRAGFEDVGAIRGIHVQTMRVRTSFAYVADIGYAPPDVYAQIPTIDYMGMRVVHPDFQRMDQHLAFCFPFNGPPREDVFHRWRKDLKRFNLLAAHYPIVAEGASAAAALTSSSAALSVPVAGEAPGLTVALHGFAAYALLRRALDELAAARGRRAEVAAPALACAVEAGRVTVEAPVAGPVVFASPWPERALAGMPFRVFDPYMDIYPTTYRTADATVLSTAGRLLAVAVVRAAPGLQALVVTPQYLLLWLLFEAHRRPADRAVYRAYYAHTLEVLRAAEALLADAPELFAKSPFAPAVTTLGDTNHDAAYVIKMAASARQLREAQPPAALGLPPGIVENLRGLPQNYYCEGSRPPFDYQANVLFHRSGAERPQ